MKNVDIIKTYDYFDYNFFEIKNQLIKNQRDNETALKITKMVTISIFAALVSIIFNNYFSPFVTLLITIGIFVVLYFFILSEKFLQNIGILDKSDDNLIFFSEEYFLKNLNNIVSSYFVLKEINKNFNNENDCIINRINYVESIKKIKNFLNDLLSCCQNSQDNGKIKVVEDCGNIENDRIVNILCLINESLKYMHNKDKIKIQKPLKDCLKYLKNNKIDDEQCNKLCKNLES